MNCVRKCSRVSVSTCTPEAILRGFYAGFRAVHGDMVWLIAGVHA